MSKLRSVLLGLGDDRTARTELEHGFVDRFVPVTDEDYDDTRKMLLAADRAEFLTLA